MCSDRNGGRKENTSLIVATRGQQWHTYWKMYTAVLNYIFYLLFLSSGNNLFLKKTFFFTFPDSNFFLLSENTPFAPMYISSFSTSQAHLFCLVFLDLFIIFIHLFHFFPRLSSNLISFSTTILTGTSSFIGLVLLQYNYIFLCMCCCLCIQ